MASIQTNLCCDRTSTRFAEYYDHCVMHHDTPRHIYHCYVCSDTTESYCALLYHLESHKYGVRRYPFDCAHNSTRFDHLVVHLRAPKPTRAGQGQGHGYNRDDSLDLLHKVWKIERNKREILDSQRKIPYSPPVYCRLQCEYSTNRLRNMRLHLNKQAGEIHYSHFAAGHLTADEVENVLRRLWPELRLIFLFNILTVRLCTQ